MGREAISPTPRLSQPGTPPVHYPSVMRDRVLATPHQGWSTDSTALRLARGCVYLVAVMDEDRRDVRARNLANTRDTSFCRQTRDAARHHQRPPIFTTDHGAHCTSHAFLTRLYQAEVHMSGDGRGRARDKGFSERLWRTVNYAEVYLYDSPTLPQATQRLATYFWLYNHERLHHGE